MDERKYASTYTTLDKEALETSNAGLNQRHELIGIARNDAAVEANIDPALALGGSHLFLESVKCRRRWDGIEWHINDGRHTTTRGSSGSSPEALPLCPSWLVEVDMCVD